MVSLKTARIRIFSGGQPRRFGVTLNLFKSRFKKLTEAPGLPVALVTFALFSKQGYYHLRSTVKRERFFAHAYFSNETVSQTTVSTRPMKMFSLEHETMNVCQRNVARFDHVECMFDKINDIF